MADLRKRLEALNVTSETDRFIQLSLRSEARRLLKSHRGLGLDSEDTGLL